MSHRSLPPSHYARSRSLLAILSNPARLPQPTANSRVQVFPSADGTVLIVGVTTDGAWVAEYRCLATDFDARCIQAMERRVMLKERSAPQLVR